MSETNKVIKEISAKSSIEAGQILVVNHFMRKTGKTTAVVRRATELNVPIVIGEANRWGTYKYETEVVELGYKVKAISVTDMYKGKVPYGTTGVMFDELNLSEYLTLKTVCQNQNIKINGGIIKED